MAEHGRALAYCHAAFERGHLTPVAAALAGAARVFHWRHYPEGDAHDPTTHAQYFYHAHPLEERGAAPAGEHGHFHTFLRQGGMPLEARPLVMPELAIAGNPAAPRAMPAPSAPAGGENDPWTHLVGIAMDRTGRPLRLFTTNRWVTGETWYAAADTAAALPRFALRREGDATILDQWMTALVGLFRPEIAALLMARDAAIVAFRQKHRSRVHVLEDRRLEIASWAPLDIDAQRRRVDAALRHSV